MYYEGTPHIKSFCHNIYLNISANEYIISCKQHRIHTVLSIIKKIVDFEEQVTAL